jgi:glycosyltransferase involved in cell wall biosynthesis
MKVLFIGNYRDSTGWGNSAIGFLLAMDSVGIDVVPRHIKLNNINGEVSERIKELEAKSDKDCDIVIQHVLPHMLDYSGHFKKNIAICCFETSNFRKTPWASKINTMDELWVLCNQSVKIAKDSGVEIPIKVITPGFDMSKYEQKYKPLDFNDTQGKFKFYFIGEMVRRKNIEALLIAFYTNFTLQDNVCLIIKAGVPGASPEQNAQSIKQLISGVKKGLKLYPSQDMYAMEIGVAANMTNEEIMRLHATCDCFVMPSYGEAFGIPCFESMAMGKVVIANDCGGMSDYLSHSCGVLVKNREQPIFNMLDTFNELGTGHETWSSIDIIELGKEMRRMYENPRICKEYSELGIDGSYEYSYQNVGGRIKNLLEENYDVKT